MIISRLTLHDSDDVVDLGLKLSRLVVVVVVVVSGGVAHFF